MRDMKRAWIVAQGNLSHWRKDYRVWVIAIVEILLLLRYLLGFTLYGIENGKKITPFLLPILMADAPISNGLLKVMILFGIILLFCNAPFLHEQKTYAIIRIGRNAWWKGECLYIVIASLLYVCFICIVSALIVLPCISFNEYWGGILGAYLKNPMIIFQKNQGLVIPDVILWNVAPLSATIYTFLCMWAFCSVIGFLLLLINLGECNSWIGIAVAVVLVLADPVVYSIFLRERSWLWIFSPATWISMQSLAEFSQMGILSEGIVAFGYSFLLVICMVLIRYRTRTIEIKMRGNW